jgi:UDP-GlcNAc:undecaprenyl-phosphate GlcNAc-1-phosphate transferase
MSVGAYIGPVIALAFTSGLILWLSPLAKAVGLVDVPNARKVHQGEIPLVGGLAIFVAVFAANVISGFVLPEGVRPVDYSGFYLAGMLLVLIGMIDDFVDLSPLHKIVVQTLATLIMVFGAQIVLRDLGVIGNDNNVLSLGIMAIPFTIFTTIGVINAVNMSDGLDGLAGSLSLVSLLGFLAATMIFGSGDGAPHILMLAAAVGGFLLFNFRIPGRSGSMFLGFSLAWFAIKFSQGDNRIIAPSAALWFLILPLFDAVAMTTRRIMKKRPAFGADKEHLHHIFLLAGFTVTETVGILAGIAALGVGVGLAGTYFRVPDVIMGGSFLALGLLYLRMIVHSWAVMRFLRYSICRRQSADDRRVVPDRRVASNVVYMGAERRSGSDRRSDPRRDEDTQTHIALGNRG